jgi:lysophospholipase L1-like esterase
MLPLRKLRLTLFLLLPLGLMAAPDAPAPVYELRTYTAVPGRLPDVLARFRDHTVGIFNRHGMSSLAYWVVTDAKDGAPDKLVYVLRHPSRELATRHWAEFRADPEWKSVSKASEAHGKIVLKAESVFMTATDFSPALGAAPSAVRATAPALKIAEPRSPIVPDDIRYLNRTELLPPCVARVAAIHGQPCDVVFIGDSITAGWLGKGKAVWEKYYGSRHPLDFGIGGDKTQNVLWRLEHLDVKDLRPKVAVLLIGTNNLANTADEVAAGVKAVLQKTQETFPGVKTIVVSIMPNRRANAKMMEANETIKRYADDSSVFYLDLVPVMTPVGDNWKGLGADHLHPDADGYEIWAAAMEPLLNKLLSAAP